jgi:flagellar biosynthesis protein FlhB
MANDKTEKATPKKKRDARKKGQAAKSQDVIDWAGVLVGAMLIPALVRHMADNFTESFSEIRRAIADPTGAMAARALGHALQRGFMAAVPLFVAVIVTTVAVTVGQTGLLLTGTPLKPDPKRLNPIAGFKRLLSPLSAWTTAKQLVRMAIITLLTYPRVHDIVEELAGRGHLELNDALDVMARGLLSLVKTVAFWMLLLALADYGYQRFEFTRKLRMTKQEIRDEFKQAEGDGMIKARIRSMQRALAQNRMMADLPTANVVVTNPTHIAVALRYDPAVSRAPKVVAVGAGSVALRIRTRATEHRIPIVEAKPLARALWRACEAGDEIPVTLYEAVAKVLAFVHRLDKRFGVARPLELPRTMQVDHETLDAVGRKRHRGRRRRPARAPVPTGAAVS